MKRLVYLLIFYSLYSNAQYESAEKIHYMRIEGGFQKYYLRTLDVDPTMNWLGYELNKEQDAWFANFIWGWDFEEKTLLGLGAGYLNYEGINGVQVFSDINFFISNTRVNPYLGLRGGYSHIWNQYTNGSGSFTGTFFVGIQYSFGTYSSLRLYLQSGLKYTHQALFFPLSLGFQF